MRKRLAALLRTLADRFDRGEPPALRLRHPRLGARWRFDGRTYVLVSFSVSDVVMLQYAEMGSWEAASLIDPHIHCRPKRPAYPFMKGKS
jgi:hypothetical protein